MTKLRALIAANLARIRRAEGLSQTQLATRAQITQPTVSKIERGEGASLEMIENLAGAMGRDPTEFFRRTKS